MKSKEDKIKAFLIIGLALGSFCAVVFYILYCTEAFFHSDMASYVLLAKEQIAKKQFFPDDFCYSTGVFVFTAELFVAPLMLFLSDWVLCREIAVILLNILLGIVVFVFFRNINRERKITITPWIVLALWCIPMGHYEETVYEAAYIPFIIFELCMMLAFHMLISERYKRKKTYYAALFLAVFAANVEGIRNLVIMVLPLIAAIIIYLLIDNWKNLSEIFRSKMYCYIWGITIIAAGCGTVVFKFLSELVQLQSGTAGVSFLAEGAIPESFKNLVMGIMRYYGAIGEGGLFSISGITACINFVVMVVCTIVIPVSMLIWYRKINSPFWKIYTIYCWISNFIVLYMMVFSTAGAIRYYYTVFWHNLVLTALVFGYLIEKGHKYISTFFVMAVLAASAAGHINYLLNTVYPIKVGYEEDKELGTITEYLEANNLTYGFASYWNAYKNMVLSDGKVKIISWCAHPNEPFYWLTSREWYDPKAYSGKCFILIQNGEVISNEYYNLASEIKHFRDYTILVYDKHIYLYGELNQIHVQGAAVNADCSIYSVPLEGLSLGDNAYYANGKLGLKQNGIQFGPYFTLTEGTYRMQITGENLSKLETVLSIDGEETEIPLQKEECTDEMLSFSFGLTEMKTGVEIKNSNSTENDIIITNITISK